MLGGQRGRQQPVFGRQKDTRVPSSSVMFTGTMDSTTCLPPVHSEQDLAQLLDTVTEFTHQVSAGEQVHVA